jgi:hypothetical protein
MNVKVRLDGVDKLIRKLRRVSDQNLQQQFALWLEASGFEFIDVIQDEVKRLQTVDTRRLLNSFDKGSTGNIWEIKNGGLTIQIGTNLKYAKIVNDGHWTNPQGVATRWVPGKWRGDRFEYDPGADTGMLLKQQWIEGQPYWDNALVIFKRLFAESFERKFSEWIRSEL